MVLIATTSMANGPGAPFHELWIPMDAGIVDGSSLPGMVQRVPDPFRQKESCNGCFDPMVVSIGPYHHGKSELQEVENLKHAMMFRFIEACQREISNIYNAVERISGYARRCYPAEERVSRFDETQFTRLMLVDGCFVLQFIDNFLNKDEEEHVIRSDVAVFVRRDLMLLENQLPYIVLETLMRLRFEGNRGDELIYNFFSSFRGDLSSHTTCMQATFKFFDKCFSIFKDLSSICQEPNNTDKPLHLLDIFLRRYINTRDLGRTYFQGRQGRDSYSYPAAKELEALGIHFRPSAGEHFTDIEFRSTLAAGWLFLPQIMIDDTTKSMLLNLVAYEASRDAPDDPCGLTSYICFMDSLIRQVEDVKVLISKGIVFNLLRSDHQAAKLFSDIAKDLKHKPYAFRVTRQRIDSHYRSRIRTSMAGWIHNQFRNPLTLIAFVTVTATTVMAFLQTFFTVKGYYSGKGS